MWIRMGNSGEDGRRSAEESLHERPEGAAEAQAALGASVFAQLVRARPGFESEVDQGLGVDGVRLILVEGFADFPEGFAGERGVGEIFKLAMLVAAVAGGGEGGFEGGEAVAVELNHLVVAAEVH